MNSCDVFICYESTTGESYAKKLKEALEEIHCKVFLAKSSIRSGEKWEEKRDLALTQCKYFVVVITIDFLRNKIFN